MELVHSSDEVFKDFLTFIVLPAQDGSTHTRIQQLDMLRHLVSLFFVNISDDDWINCR